MESKVGSVDIGMRIRDTCKVKWTKAEDGAERAQLSPSRLRQCSSLFQCWIATNGRFVDRDR